MRFGDVSYYSADILNRLYNKLSHAGYILIENWSSPEIREVIFDFRATNQIHEEIVEIQGSTAFWKKTEAIKLSSVETISATIGQVWPGVPDTNHENQDCHSRDFFLFNIYNRAQREYFELSKRYSDLTGDVLESGFFPAVLNTTEMNKQTTMNWIVFLFCRLA